MPSLAAIRADNAALSPSYLPVALFVGGTSGIGQATAQAFAHHTKGEAHIIICGRNRAAADSIIASFPKSPKSRYEFVQCDATLLKNVASMTTKLIAERGTGRLLGAQIVGREQAAKRIDVLATALWNGMTVEDIIGLDLAYAPPFAPVWDPVLIAARKAALAVIDDRKTALAVIDDRKA